MKQRFRLYRRTNGGRFYLQDDLTGKQTSLRTNTRDEAERLCHAKNEATRQPLVNVQIARAYLAANDPQIANRTWLEVAKALASAKHGTTQKYYERAFTQKAFDLIRDMTIVQTRPEHFIQVMEAGTVSTNKNLRIVHNFALGMGWLPWPILAKKQWPQLHYRERRGITLEEHQAILAIAKTVEFKTYLEMAWCIGAAQGDLASIKAENIDWEHRVISFYRQKTRTLCVQRFADELAAILEKLPRCGPLFPTLIGIGATERAAMFRALSERCGYQGLTLHSYRYAWAERARTAGYPERFAQEALGHKSKAVHAAYARKARVELPALEDYERKRAEQKVIALQLQTPGVPATAQANEPTPDKAKEAV